MKLKVLAVVLDDFPFWVGHNPHSMGVTSPVVLTMMTSLAELSLLNRLDSPINPNAPNVKSKEE